LRSKREIENSAPRSNITVIAIVSNLAKKTEVSTDTSNAYYNKRSRKKKCSSNQKTPTRTRRIKKRNEKELLYNECEQKKKKLL